MIRQSEYRRVAAEWVELPYGTLRHDLSNLTGRRVERFGLSGEEGGEQGPQAGRLQAARGQGEEGTAEGARGAVLGRGLGSARARHQHGRRHPGRPGPEPD